MSTNVSGSISCGNVVAEFMSLSTNVISLIIGKFLTMHDISKLDVAYCSKRQRKLLLDILSDNPCIVYDNIKLKGSSKYVNNAFIYIGSRKINVLKLSLNDRVMGQLTKLTNFGLIGLTGHCTRLQSLDISHSNITNCGVFAIALNTKCSLQSLDMYGCKNITDISVIQIAKHCPRLEQLDIRLCKITDKSVIHIAINCSSLLTLKASGCKQITDASIRRIAKNCPRLLELDIGWCDKITNISISKIAKYCLGLQQLSIGHCYNVNDKSIIQIAIKCTGLRLLDVMGCTRITDDSMIAIANTSPLLNTDSCYNITDTSINKIAICTSLQSLNVCGCNVTNAGIIKIAQQCTGLQLLHIGGSTIDRQCRIDIHRLLPNLRLVG